MLRLFTLVFSQIRCFLLFFFFNDTATTEIYTLSLHDALPICTVSAGSRATCSAGAIPRRTACPRSEEHTSELQSHSDLVCRLLLEKKKKRAPPQFPCAQRSQPALPPQRAPRTPRICLQQRAAA